MRIEFLQSVLILFPILCLVSSAGVRNDLVTFILDFLGKEQVPKNINAYLCWDKKDMIRLSQELWNNNYRIRFSSTTGVPIGVSPRHQWILIDSDCEKADGILQKANDEYYFNQPYQWIFVGNISRIMSRNLNIGVDSKFFVIENKGESFHVTTPYKYSKNSNGFVQNEITEWQKNSSFHFFNHLNIGRNRTNLNGLTLKISYVITNPDSLKHLWDYRDKHVDTISKLNYLLIHYLTDFTNASRDFIMQKSWGYKQKNSSFYDGMVGDLQKREADLGGTASFFTYDRVEVVDYIAAPYRTYMKFIFRSPPLSYVSNIFALPFDNYVWYSSLGILLLTCLSIYLVVVWEWKDPTFNENFIDDPHSVLRPSIADVVLLEISAITQQGYPKEPKSLAGRIASVSIFIVVIFLYTSYSASIVVLLQSTTDSIRTLDDFLNSRIKLGVEDIVYAHYYFKTAKEPIKKAIYEQKIAPRNQKANFMTVQEGIKRVQNEFFGFHVELSTGYKVIGDFFKESEKCGLQEVTFVNLIEPWLPIQKNSNYKEIMKVGMRRIHEHGLQQREAFKLYTRKPVCTMSQSNFGSVGLIDCYFAFVIFGIGILFSSIIIVTEIFLVHYTNQKAKRKSMLLRSIR